MPSAGAIVREQNNNRPLDGSRSIELDMGGWYPQTFPLY